MPQSTPNRPFLVSRTLLGHPRAPWIFGLSLSILALIQALHRARQGRCALLKWDHHFESFFEGAALYGIGAEGYPTLPLSLVVMSPFHLAGPLPGAMLWAALKVGLAWWIVTRALRLAESGSMKISPGWILFLIAISFRPLLSDVTHGNLNLLVGATVASAAWFWFRGSELASGFWLGIGAVLKVTPALGAIWFIRKGSVRGLAGIALGVGLGLLLPAFVVGGARTWDYTLEWWQQMVTPYLAAERLDLLQTEHINQSLFGVLARYFTDSVAIPAGTAGLTQDLSIHVVDLGLALFHNIHRSVSLLVLAFLLWCSKRNSGRPEGLQTLGEFSLLALAMLFLSERSWKHHYVLLVFPMAFLLYHWRFALEESSRRLGSIAVILATLLYACTGSGFLGRFGSKLAEAYGVFLLGGLILFFASGSLLRGSSKAPRSPAPE